MNLRERIVDEATRYLTRFFLEGAIMGAIFFTLLGLIVLGLWIMVMA